MEWIKKKGGGDETEKKDNFMREFQEVKETEDRETGLMLLKLRVLKFIFKTIIIITVKEPSALYSCG